MAEDKVTVRNLVDSEFGTPLRRFKGTLKEYHTEDQKFGTMVILNFADIDDVKSVEPYEFPTASISIKLSNRKRSGWGIFSDSLADLLQEDEDIKDCVGKVMVMEMEEGHIYGKDRDTGENLIGNPWKVIELEGAVASAEGLPSATDRAKELLLGKTRAEFNKAAYADSTIRKDTDLIRSITDKSFINSLLQLEEVVEDENGVFKAGPKAAA